MIPRIIHYCWFGGAPLPPLITRCMDSWKRALPDYQIMCWNENNVKFDTPFLQEMKNKKQWAFVSDYVRMRVLYEFGGIYLDTDIEVIRPFDPLLCDPCFVGYESAGRINTAVVGAIKQHPFPALCMELIDQRFGTGKSYLIAPEVATTVYKEIPEKVKVYEEEYFYPYNPYDSQRSTSVLMYADITDKTYAIHHWNKAWQIPLRSKVVNYLKKLFV